MNSTAFDLTPWRWKLATADIHCVMAEKTVCLLQSLPKKIKNEWQPFKSLSLLKTTVST